MVYNLFGSRGTRHIDAMGNFLRRCTAGKAVLHNLKSHRGAAGRRVIQSDKQGRVPEVRPLLDEHGKIQSPEVILIVPTKEQYYLVDVHICLTVISPRLLHRTARLILYKYNGAVT